MINYILFMIFLYEKTCEECSLCFSLAYFQNGVLISTYKHSTDVLIH